MGQSVTKTSSEADLARALVTSRNNIANHTIFINDALLQIQDASYEMIGQNSSSISAATTSSHGEKKMLITSSSTEKELARVARQIATLIYRCVVSTTMDVFLQRTDELLDYLKYIPSKQDDILQLRRHLLLIPGAIDVADVFMFIGSTNTGVTWASGISLLPLQLQVCKRIQPLFDAPLIFFFRAIMTGGLTSITVAVNDASPETETRSPTGPSQVVDDKNAVRRAIYEWIEWSLTKRDIQLMAQNSSSEVLRRNIVVESDAMSRVSSQVLHSFLQIVPFNVTSRNGSILGNFANDPIAVATLVIMYPHIFKVALPVVSFEKLVNKLIDCGASVDTIQQARIRYHVRSRYHDSCFANAAYVGRMDLLRDWDFVNVVSAYNQHGQFNFLYESRCDIRVQCMKALGFSASKIARMVAEIDDVLSNEEIFDED